MKEIHQELTYPRSPGEVFDLISTGEFQLALIAHIGGKNPEVVEETRRDDGSVKLVTKQQAGVDLPGFAKKLVPANATVIQTYEWDPPQADGSRKGRWSAEPKGAPISIGGPTELTADGTGSKHVYMGQVKSSIPVVGGRLEGFAMDNLKKELTRTGEFTTTRLAP